MGSKIRSSGRYSKAFLKKRSSVFVWLYRAAITFDRRCATRTNGGVAQRGRGAEITETPKWFLGIFTCTRKSAARPEVPRRFRSTRGGLRLSDPV